MISRPAPNHGGNFRDTGRHLTIPVSRGAGGVVYSNKSVDALRRELQGLEDLMFLLSPERRKRLKPMLEEVRRQIKDAEKAASDDDKPPARRA